MIFTDFHGKIGATQALRMATALVLSSSLCSAFIEIPSKNDVIDAVGDTVEDFLKDFKLGYSACVMVCDNGRRVPPPTSGICRPYVDCAQAFVSGTSLSDFGDTFGSAAFTACDVSQGDYSELYYKISVHQYSFENFDSCKDFYDLIRETQAIDSCKCCRPKHTYPTVFFFGCQLSTLLGAYVIKLSAFGSRKCMFL
jgi:hypothetical protein